MDDATRPAPRSTPRSARSPLRLPVVALAAAGLSLLVGCSTVRSAVLLPLEVADRSLDLAGKSLGVAAQGVELAAKTGWAAQQQIRARAEGAASAARAVGEAARDVRDAHPAHPAHAAP